MCVFVFNLYWYSWHSCYVVYLPPVRVDRRYGCVYLNTEIHWVSGVSQTRKARRTAVAAPVMGSERRNGLHGAFPRPESVEYFHHSGYGPAADGAGLPHQLPPARCAGALVPARHARVRAPRVHAHRALVERWRACAATASTNGGACSRGFLRISDAIICIVPEVNSEYVCTHRGGARNKGRRNFHLTSKCLYAPPP